MVTIILYRLEYLSISLMALLTLLTLFKFHFELSLRGQIECSMSMVMGLKASPSRFLTSSLLQSQFSTWLSQTLTILLLYLVFWFTLQQSSNRFSKSKNCQKFRPNLRPRLDKSTTPIQSFDYPKRQIRPKYSVEYGFKIQQLDPIKSSLVWALNRLSSTCGQG